MTYDPRYEKTNISHMQKQNRRSAYCKADQLTAKLISNFVFATRIIQFLYFLNPKFPVSGHLLCLYSSVCVEIAAHISMGIIKVYYTTSSVGAQVLLRDSSYDYKSVGKITRQKKEKRKKDKQYT